MKTVKFTQCQEIYSTAEVEISDSEYRSLIALQMQVRNASDKRTKMRRINRLLDFAYTLEEAYQPTYDGADYGESRILAIDDTETDKVILDPSELP